MPTYTFGFEAEYQTNVQEIATLMHRQDLTIDDRLHNYTCDCEGCEVIKFDYDTDESDHDHSDIYHLRIKSDSSCDGELISRIWDDPNDNRVRNLWSAIEKAAIAVDTEPGLSSGFHVHVGRSHLDLEKRGRLVVAMTAWEPVLLDIAAGRWPANRNWNMSLSNLLNRTYTGLVEDFGDPLTHSPITTVIDRLRDDSTTAQTKRTVCRTIAREHQEIDRHSSMAFSERYATMEFRLWNSTRSAFRMELWCRLSLMLADPVFVDMLIDSWKPDLTRDDFVATVAEYVCSDLGHGRQHAKTYWLLYRQNLYLKNCRDLNITQSTPFTMT